MSKGIYSHSGYSDADYEPPDWQDDCPCTDCEEVPGSQMDGWPGGDWITVKCKQCGALWEVELPQ